MKYILYSILLLSVHLLEAQAPADTGRRPPAVKKSLAVKKETKETGHLPAVFGVDTTGKKPDAVLALQAALFKAGRAPVSYLAVLQANPYYGFFGPPENLVAGERQSVGKEGLFYLMAGLLFFFALIKQLFNRYVSNLLGLLFRGSLRQKQIREQLLQTPLPSLFLNIFFVIVAGLYIFFLLQYYQVLPGTPFWLLLLYCIVAVAVVYVVKFMILKLTGWIFNMRDAADTYIFIVFLINKLLAIFLLPLLIVMAFALSSWQNVLLTLSYIMVALFFAYRYIVSFAPVRREVKVSQFHFFMYLCAFEVIPLLLIYKVLLHFF